MNLLTDEAHNEGLDEPGIEGDVHETQGDFSAVEDDLREMTYICMLVVCILYL